MPVLEFEGQDTQGGKILVLGIGNLIMTDDSIGVRVVQHLEAKYRFPPEVHCMDGGTLGLDILPYLEGVERAILVDAVNHGGEPGSCVRLDGEELHSALSTKVSPHQVGVTDLLATAELLGYTPAEVVLVGIQPQCVEIGPEPTPEVQHSLPVAKEMVLKELARWGVAAEPILATA